MQQLARGECATARLRIVVHNCPPGHHIYVHRRDGITILFIDPRSTRVAIAWAIKGEGVLTQAERDVLRKAYRLPPSGAIPAGLLGNEGDLCDRRIPHELRMPSHVTLPHRRRATDFLFARQATG